MQLRHLGRTKYSACLNFEKKPQNFEFRLNLINFYKSRFLCFDFHRGQCKAETESKRARAESAADILRQLALRQKLKTTIENC